MKLQRFPSAERFVLPGELELFCLGPLTNVALALRMDPGLGQKLKHCYVMGGNYQGLSLPGT